MSDETNAPNEFAAWVRAFRAAQGWSLAQMAEAVGVSRSLILRWETGERVVPNKLSMDALVRAARKHKYPLPPPRPYARRRQTKATAEPAA